MNAAIRVVRILWLLATIGFAVAGAALIAAFPWWQGLTLAVTLFSAALHPGMA